MARYDLRIAGRDVTVQVEDKGEGVLEATVGTDRLEVAYRIVDESMIRLAVGGKAVNAFVASAAQGTLVNIDGTTWLVQDMRDDAASPARRGRLSAAPKEVTPPMPSVVVRILVSAGDPVRKGDPVVVVSAMKMETTLVAPFDGTVKAVSCAEGDKVAPGQILVHIDPDEGRFQERHRPEG